MGKRKEKEKELSALKKRMARSWENKEFLSILKNPAYMENETDHPLQKANKALSREIDLRKPYVIRGQKVCEGASQGGIIRKSVCDVFWKEIQKKANIIWEKNPNLSRIQVAKSLKKNFPDIAESTLRQRIKKPQK